MKEWQPEEIKELRAKYDISQAKFSEMVGVTANYIFLLERGDKTPSKVLRLLLDCLEDRIAEPEKKRKSYGQRNL
jgi:DNA-binding transcriptional regulator YiaG